MAGRLPVGITCFAKWTDDTWYNLEILAKNEASYTVTYIDYGNSEDVLEGDIVGDVGEIPDTDYIDQFVKIKDPMETLIINNRPVTLKRGQHAVTILCIWCSKQMMLNGAKCYRMVLNGAESSESVSKMFNANQNLLEDILGAAVASITNADVQENPPCKI